MTSGHAVVVAHHHCRCRRQRGGVGLAPSARQASSHYFDARVQVVSATTSAATEAKLTTATITTTFCHHYDSWYFSAPDSTAIDRRIALSPPEVFQTSEAERSFITE